MSQPRLSAAEVRWWASEVAREEAVNDDWSPASRQQAARDMERWAESRASWSREAMAAARRAQELRRLPASMRPRRA